MIYRVLIPEYCHFSVAMYGMLVLYNKISNEMRFIVQSFVHKHFNSSILQKCKCVKPETSTLYINIKYWASWKSFFFMLVENKYLI